MRNLLILISTLLVFSACQKMQQYSRDTRDAAYEFVYGEDPNIKPAPRVMDSKYCYKTRSDILCYNQPQLDKEEQFIGAQ